MSFLNFNWHKPSGAVIFSRECVCKLNPLMESHAVPETPDFQTFFIFTLYAFISGCFLPATSGEKKIRGTHMLKRGDEGSDANRVLPEAAIAAD